MLSKWRISGRLALLSSLALGFATPVAGFLAAAALGGYFASLQPLSELAEKKKEVLIEALCR